MFRSFGLLAPKTIVIKDDDSDQVHVYKDNRWTALCYSDDLTLAEYLCSITGFG
jgi:hypothetical protein